jgi:biofilm PGA synthesis N-glycosyltransferase PgaC
MTVGEQSLRYVLITPARNEEKYIENTIRSVIDQSVRPICWLIVNDGSTDRTRPIIESFASTHPWIRCINLPERKERHFGGKARAFNEAYAIVKDLDFGFIGNLDADITIPSDYYEFLISRFTENPKLGVAGTPFVEDFSKPHAHTYSNPGANLSHVSGASQFFRRACFDEIGGYQPIKGGGIDWLAVTTARMKGWTTRTFVEKVCFHHRKMGTAGRNPLAARFKHGQEDYYVGGHPVWQLLRGCFQMKEKPYVLGGVALIAGYFWAYVRRMESPIPQELKAFHRAEQISRLRQIVFRSRTIA